MGIAYRREGYKGGDDARQLMSLALKHAEIRLAVLGMAAMRTTLPLPGDRGAGLLIADAVEKLFGSQRPSKN